MKINDLKKQMVNINDLLMNLEQQKTEINNLKIQSELQKIETNTLVENYKDVKAFLKIQTDLLKNEADKADKVDKVDKIDKLVELVNFQTREIENLKKIIEKPQKMELENNSEKVDDTESMASYKKRQFNLHYRFSNTKNTEDESNDRERSEEGREQKRRGFRDLSIKEPEPTSAHVPDKNQCDAKRKIAAANYFTGKRIHRSS
jgi:hypothetical protein